LKEPSSIIIGMDYDFDYDQGRPPPYCTLDFEEIAKVLMAMGYERDARAYNRGGYWTWGFGKDVPEHKAGFGIEVPVYELKTATGKTTVCIKSFRIGGGVYHG
jgi:hypothetical protein